MKNLLRPHWRPLTFLLSLCLGGGLVSCETDLDPNDSYHETTIVYAVLDPSLPRQTVRINKAFLNTRTNALTIAATQPDSTTFPEGVIEASLEWLNPGPDSSLIISYPLDRVLVTNKEPGAFYGPDQIVYQTPTTMPPIDPAKIYRVRVLNKRTGIVSTGTTSIPDPKLLRFLLAGAKRINPSIPGSDTTRYDFEPQKKLGIIVKPQPKAGIYRAEMDFHFSETTGGVTTEKVLTWELFGEQTTDYSQTSDEFPSPGIYAPEFAFFEQFLANKLDVSHDPGDMVRRPGNIVFRVTAGSPQWATYFQVLNLSSAILQTTPDFTNVRGGRGLIVGRAQNTSRQWVNRFGPSYDPPGMVEGVRDAFRRYPQFKFLIP